MKRRTRTRRVTTPDIVNEKTCSYLKVEKLTSSSHNLGNNKIKQIE